MLTIILQITEKKYAVHLLCNCINMRTCRGEGELQIWNKTSRQVTLHPFQNRFGNRILVDVTCNPFNILFFYNFIQKDVAILFCCCHPWLSASDLKLPISEKIPRYHGSGCVPLSLWWTIISDNIITDTMLHNTQYATILQSNT